LADWLSVSNTRRSLGAVLRVLEAVVVLAAVTATVGGIVWMAVVLPDLDGPETATVRDLTTALADPVPLVLPAAPDGPTASTAADQPSPPTVYGDDPALDGLWDGCRDGSGLACDQLFEQAPIGSEYERFGVSCGERPDVLHCQLELDGTPLPVPELPLS
jgi:hypothetical protein